MRSGFRSCSTLHPKTANFKLVVTVSPLMAWPSSLETSPETVLGLVRLPHSSREITTHPSLSVHRVVWQAKTWRRSGQSVTASDFGSNGPRFETGRGRCVESLDKALYSHCPKEKPSH